RENIMLSRPRRLSRADEPTHPLAPRLTRVVWPASGGGKGRTGRPQLTARSLLVAVAATALVVMLCGAASLSLARQMQLPILGFAPTAIPSPTATLEPTATLAPTATATLAPTPKPILRLTVPTFTWTRSVYCMGTTKITNASSVKAQGWRWQS